MPLARPARFGPPPAAALLLVAALAFGVGAREKEAAGEPPAPAALEALADSVFAPRTGAGIASASLAGFRGDGVLSQKGYGLARPRAKAPADPSVTVYNVGSNSKLFVAAAALQLRERGLLRLEEDVNRHLKQFRLAATFPRP